MDAMATPEDDLADAHHAISYASTWVNNADTKAGLLATAEAVVVATLASERRLVIEVLGRESWGQWVAVVMLLLLVGSLLLGLIALALTITPRTPTGPHGRFGWPSLAADDWPLRPATRSEAANEGWSQARTLSRIASRKFAALKIAVPAILGALPLSVIWVVVATWSVT